MIVALLLGAALFADATPAASGLTPANAPAPAAAPAKAEDPDPIVCKNEPIVGSRLPRKVCMRKSEKLARERRDQDATANLERLSIHGPHDR